MSPVQEAMQGTGGSIGNTIGMGGGHARHGGPDLGQQMAGRISDAELAARMHYVPPPGSDGTQWNGSMAPRTLASNATDLPSYYNNFDGLPVAYSAPSALKEHMDLKSSIRQAAAQEPRKDKQTEVIRTDPITEGEVQYLKSMKDQAELAQFDDYVESFIDPRQPGNMKWLMEVYPDYVNRRLQQAHTDYEFALRNQMIDSWGINTFDDLHFKYMVDQGKINGPGLINQGLAVDAQYAAGYLAPWRFRREHRDAAGNLTSFMALPFNSARIGKKPTGEGWVSDRSNRPLGSDRDQTTMAQNIYRNPRAT